MKLVIKILFCLLLVALLLTTIEFLRWLVPSFSDDNIDPDIKKYEYLATQIFLIVYFFVVFLEIELFVGLRCLLLGIERRRVPAIIFSGLLILSVLAEGILCILADKYSSIPGMDFSGWILGIPAVIIVLNLILFLLPKEKREQNNNCVLEDKND